MVAKSRGIFGTEKDTDITAQSKRVVYEVLFHCPDGCNETSLIEWYIKPQNIDQWDIAFFGEPLDSKPLAPSIEELREDESKARKLKETN